MIGLFLVVALYQHVSFDWDFTLDDYTIFQGLEVQPFDVITENKMSRQTI